MKRVARILVMASGFIGIIVSNDIRTFSIEFWITILGVILVAVATHMD